MSIIGAHVSAAISLDLSLDRAKEIGAEASQIFVSPPRQWMQLKHTEEEIQNYLKKAAELKIGPNFIHGTYLINLGTQDPVHLQKSIDWLIYAMDMAYQLNIKGVIFHTGSHKGVGFSEILPQIINAITQVLQNSKNSCLLLENSAGAGNVIGDKFSELGAILKGVGDSRLKVCLDTCHSFAAGYDVKSPIGLKSVLEEFDQEIGLDNLMAIHANDSKFELKSNKDRHANIGEGFIGTDGFSNLINHTALKEIPFILEVPGFADSGPDKENVDKLKSLRNTY